MKNDHKHSVCSHLEDHSKFDCNEHSDPYECVDMIIVKTSYGYGIPIHDGGSSSVEINFCPWCGIKIDKS